MSKIKLMSHTTLTLCVLGLFSLRPQPHLTLRRKERALLAYLAITARPHDRRHLVHLFAANAAHPAASLRLLLSRIRQMGVNIVLSQSGEIWFNPAHRVDYHSFTAALSGKLSEQTTEQIAAAISLYQGELLAGLEMDDAPEFMLWLLHERAYLHTLYEQGLFELVARGRRLGQWTEAIRWAQQLVAANPFMEAVHGQLIWLYGQIGQYDAAAAQYEQCCSILQREMGVIPGDELQTIFQTVWAKRNRGQLDPPTPSPDNLFVERTVELAELSRVWQRVQKGQGSVVWIEAEPGGGKSQLVHHFTQQLALPYLIGDCYESARHLAYSPWVDILEQHVKNTPAEIWQQLPPYNRTHLARLLPTQANRLGSVDKGDLYATYEPERLFQAVTECLMVGEARQPLILFIDNLQWADTSSLHLFHYLARRVAHLPCLLIGATRPLTMTHNPALLTLWQDIQRFQPSVLRLSPLTAAAVEQWLRQRWPTLTPSHHPTMARRLHQATGGNPLFLTELLQVLPETAHLPDTLPVPATVRELVQLRLHTLPPASQHVITILALLDAPITPSLLQTIIGYEEAEMIVALDRGVQLGLLRCDEQERFHFFHDLVREAVSSELTVVRRRLIHRQIAAALAVAYHSLSPGQQQERAGHIWRHAVAGGNDEVVFIWGQIAAQFMAHFYAYGEAIRILDTVREAYDRLPPTPEHEIQCLQVLLDLAWLIRHQGRPISEEEQLLQQAQTLLARQPHPRLQALYHLREAGWLGDKGRYEAAIAAAVNAYEHFMDLTDKVGAARSLHSIGGYQIMLSRNRQGRQILAQALSLYQLAAQNTDELLCRSSLAWADLNLGQVRSAIQTLQQALALTQASGDKLGLAHLYTTLSAAWNYFYHSDEAVALSQKAYGLYQHMGFSPYSPLLQQGLAIWHQGQTEAARQMLHEVFVEATHQHDTWLSGWAAQILGRIALEKGNLTEAERWLEQASQQRIQSGELSNQVSDMAWLGRLRLAQGQVEQALALTQAAVRQQALLRKEAYIFEAADVCLAHVAVLHKVGDDVAAAYYYQQAEAWYTFLATQLDTTAARAMFDRVARRRF